MLTRILRHEWRTLLADHTLVALLAFFGLVVGWAVWSGANWGRAQADEVSLALATTEKDMNAIRAELKDPVKPAGMPWERNPRSPTYVGGIAQNLVLHPRPFAPLSVGQADVLPARIEVSIWTPPRMLTRNYQIQNPTALLAGRFDLAFAVVYLFPLLILALSYNLLAAEKEGGTLTLLLSQPVALRQFVLGKVGLRFLVVSLFGAALSVLGVVLSGTSLVAPGVLLSLSLWLVVVLSYAAFWFALALLVDSRGRSSATNALMLAAAWLVLVVVVPGLLDVGVSLAYPMPSRTELALKMREASNDATKRGATLLAKYFEDHPDLAGRQPDYKDFVTKYFTVEQEVERAVEPALKPFELQLENQIALVARLRFLSPAVVTQEALNEIAGTSPGRYRRFRARALTFLGAWKGFFLPHVYRAEGIDATDYDAFPRFDFFEEPETTTMRRVWEGVLGLLGPSLVIAGLAAVSLRRYGVAA